MSEASPRRPCVLTGAGQDEICTAPSPFSSNSQSLWNSTWKPDVKPRGPTGSTASSSSQLHGDRWQDAMPDTETLLGAAAGLSTPMLIETALAVLEGRPQQQHPGGSTGAAAATATTARPGSNRSNSSRSELGGGSWLATHDAMPDLKLTASMPRMGSWRAGIGRHSHNPSSPTSNRISVEGGGGVRLQSAGQVGVGGGDDGGFGSRRQSAGQLSLIASGISSRLSHSSGQVAPSMDRPNPTYSGPLTCVRSEASESFSQRDGDERGSARSAKGGSGGGGGPPPSGKGSKGLRGTFLEWLSSLGVGGGKRVSGAEGSRGQRLSGTGSTAASSATHNNSGEEMQPARTSRRMSLKCASIGSGTGGVGGGGGGGLLSAAEAAAEAEGLPHVLSGREVKMLLHQRRSSRSSAYDMGDDVMTGQHHEVSSVLVVPQQQPLAKASPKQMSAIYSSASLGSYSSSSPIPSSSPTLGPHAARPKASPTSTAAAVAARTSPKDSSIASVAPEPASAVRETGSTSSSASSSPILIPLLRPRPPPPPLTAIRAEPGSPESLGGFSPRLGSVGSGGRRRLLVGSPLAAASASSEAATAASLAWLGQQLEGCLGRCCCNRIAAVLAPTAAAGAGTAWLNRPLSQAEFATLCRDAGRTPPVT